jgi:hypothetical protein
VLSAPRSPPHIFYEPRKTEIVSVPKKQMGLKLMKKPTAQGSNGLNLPTQKSTLLCAKKLAFYVTRSNFLANQITRFTS